MKKKIFIFIGLVVFIIFVTILLIPKKEKVSTLSVISTTPKNNAVFVNEKSEVSVELNREMSLEEGNNLKVKIEPQVKSEIVYQTNKIRVSPENQFEYGIKYKVSINFNGKEIYSFEFTTNPFTPEQLTNEGKLQAEGDTAYNDATRRFIEENPWYTSLPIETKEYRIVYDYDKKMFRIRFLQEQTEEQSTKAIVEDALKKLKKAGAEEPIKYYTMQPNEEF